MERQRMKQGNEKAGGMNPDFAFAVFYTIFFVLLLLVAGFGLIAEF